MVVRIIHLGGCAVCVAPIARLRQYRQQQLKVFVIFCLFVCLFACGFTYKRFVDDNFFQKYFVLSIKRLRLIPFLQIDLKFE